MASPLQGSHLDADNNTHSAQLHVVTLLNEQEAQQNYENSHLGHVNKGPGKLHFRGRFVTIWNTGVQIREKYSESGPLK